jgi:hypothetical protein
MPKTESALVILWVCGIATTALLLIVASEAL